MRLHEAGRPLVLDQVPVPVCGRGQVLVQVSTCGICRTDLHIYDGELAAPVLPLIPGHEIVGRVTAVGVGATLEVGARVGIPWLGHTCGVCRYCTSERENLCDNPGFTGYTIDGGYGEYCVADASYCFELPGAWDDARTAPLLCAGVIGYRALKRAAEPERLAVIGFGAAAHILTQVAVWQGREVYALTRPGDHEAQAFARAMGACWVGGSDDVPPVELDAAIIFAPVGTLVPPALAMLRKGGRVVCGGIHMSDIPTFPYGLLWGEREIVSVANLTRADAEEFLAIAARAKLETRVRVYPLEQANAALDDLRHGKLAGAAVLRCA